MSFSGCKIRRLPREILLFQIPSPPHSPSSFDFISATIPQALLIPLLALPFLTPSLRSWQNVQSADIKTV